MVDLPYRERERLKWTRTTVKMGWTQFGGERFTAANPKCYNDIEEKHAKNEFKRQRSIDSDKPAGKLQKGNNKHEKSTGQVEKGLSTSRAADISGPPTSSERLSKVTRQHQSVAVTL